MIELPQGSVVLVDFTYSSQTQSKVRPALVVSNSGYNRIFRDVIVMKITSRKPKLCAVSITSRDLLAGSLDRPSFVQVDAIYALEKAIICDRIGIVKPKKMQEIQERISEILAIDSPEPLK
jgi:mRNA-degrading endonuclease toxin of MazEF toxin-antitoxin module